ncbi:MAG: hypothetical protein ACRYFW_13815 [Janthinobacterium lividum]
MYRLTYLLGLLAASPSLAAGPAQQSSPALEALVKTADYQANVARLFSLIPPDVFQRCPSLVSAGSTVTMLQPVSFASDGYPLSGLWKQSFPVSGCGNDTTINLFFQGQANEKIGSVVGIPGQTHAGLTLQRDALRYVGVALAAVARGCTDVHVRSSTYDSGPSRDPKAAWHETWKSAACGHVYDVPLDFIPDATGTTIRTKVLRPAS